MNLCLVVRARFCYFGPHVRHRVGLGERRRRRQHYGLSDASDDPDCHSIGRIMSKHVEMRMRRLRKRAKPVSTS